MGRLEDDGTEGDGGRFPLTGSRFGVTVPPLRVGAGQTWVSCFRGTVWVPSRPPGCSGRTSPSRVDGTGVLSDPF